MTIKLETTDIKAEKPTTKPESVSDQLLDEAKGRYDNVMIVGVDPEGKLGITASMQNFVWLQWLLSRTSFELNVMENNIGQQTEEVSSN